MQTTSWILLAICSLALLGCTDGNPSLSTLSSIDGITFSTEKKSSETYKISTSPSCSSELTVVGQCDQRFNQLQFSIDNETTWTSISGYNTSSNGDCSDGEFKLYFPDACSAFNVSTGSDITKKISIRADQKISQNTTREATVNFSSEVITQPLIASIDAAILTEGSTLTFTVSLSAPSVGMTTINYTFNNVTTTNDDFQTPPLTSGLVTFGDGQQTAVINYITAPDTKDEDDQTFQVTLTGATGATLSNTSYIGLGTIIDDDSPPTIALTTSATPYPENISTGTFTATLSNESEKLITFTFNTADGTAVTPEDYTAVTAATYMIAPGSLSVDTSITIVDDTIDEPKQCFTGVISAPSNATIANALAEACITDNDTEPTVSIADASATEGGNLAFNVSLSAPSQQTFSVDYTLTHTSTTGDDLQSFFATGTLNFSVNTSSNTLIFTTFDDATIEGNETLAVTISNPLNTFSASFRSGNISIADSAAIGTIIDNDVYAPPTVTLLSPTSAIGTSARPTIRVSGLDAGDTVKIYNNNTCVSEIGSFVASSNSNDYLFSSALSPGAHTFYVVRTNGVMTSACPSPGLTYAYIVPTVAAIYPTNGANWNDYIDFQDGATSIYEQVDSICFGSQTGLTDRVSGCIHGGEKKKIVMTGFTSCTGLTALDTLDAFDWDCMVVSGVATIVSKGLKPNKGLRNLIDGPSLAWLNNSIVVYKDGTLITTTTPTAWWSNPISDLGGPLANASITTVKNLSDTGKIYLINADQTTYGYNITSDKISVVTMNTSKLIKYKPANSFTCTRSTGTWSNSASDDVDAILCAGNRKHLWIEARLNGAGTVNADAGIFMTNTYRSEFRNMTVTDLSHLSIVPAIELYNSNANVLRGVTIHNTSFGLLLQTSSNNLIRGLNVSQIFGPNYASMSGIEVNGASAQNNHFYNVRISNFGLNSYYAQAIYIRGPKNIFSKVNISNVLGSASTYGIRFGAYTANENILSQVIIANTTESGILFDGLVEKNIISNATIVNNTHGIYFYGASGIPKNNSISSTFIHNSVNSIFNDVSIPSGSHGNQLSDIFLSNSQSYGVVFQESGFATGSGYLLYTDVCGYDDGATLCTTMSATHVGGGAISGVTGPISADDATNPDDTAGAATFGGLSMDGMLKFDSWFRGWGKDYGVNSYNSIGSSDGALHIWDFDPMVSGHLHNRSGTGLATNSALVLDGSSCASNAVNTSNRLTLDSITFYKNAIEIEGDFIGNDNELCEANENCYYAPNIGAVQPEGARSTNYCLAAPNIRLYTRN